MMKNNTLILGTGLSLVAVLTLSSCGKSGEGSASGSAPAATSAAPAAAAPAGDLEEITPKWPKPMFVGTPVPADPLPNLEKPHDPVLSFKAPKGSTNVAKGKKVTSSDTAIIIPVPGPDALKLLTDDDADSSDGCFVELAPGPQWVQVDLEGEFNIHNVVCWHFHRQAVIVKSVVVQISDDPEFKNGVTTVYNSDIDNSVGQGKGNDPVWIQTNHGRIFDGKGTKGRYVRLWSNGNTMDDFNRYIEISVYATPAK